jgi:hypothetical protein
MIKHSWENQLALRNFHPIPHNIYSILTFVVDSQVHAEDAFPPHLEPLPNLDTRLATVSLEMALTMEEG